MNREKEKNHGERSYRKIKDVLVVVRGGGDLATGTIHRLWAAGFAVLVLETEAPAAIRRQVAVSEAVYDGVAVVEDMMAVLIHDCEEAEAVIRTGKVPVLVDPEGTSIQTLRPDIVVDAILAKRNLGTTRSMAPLTIALGPGFIAGNSNVEKTISSDEEKTVKNKETVTADAIGTDKKENPLQAGTTSRSLSGNSQRIPDVDFVIETKRGHNLGRIIREGPAIPNTGIPGNIGGYAAERVIHAACAGTFRNMSKIGDIVEAGSEIAYIEADDGTTSPVRATITGILRGLLRDGYPVTKGFKIADIDPRQEELANCFTISDKARCIAGSVLELCTAYLLN